MASTSDAAGGTPEAAAAAAAAVAAAAADVVRRQGFAAPLRAIEGPAAAALLERLGDYDRSCTGGLSGDTRFKTHLLLPWVSDLVRHPCVLDPLETLIGPDILIWSSGWAIKPPDSAGFYSWHQDSTYAGVEPADSVVVAWFALTATTTENGCVRYIPGSHLRQLPHTDTFVEDNLLSRGQHVSSADIDEGSAVDALLQPGEFALHHFRCVHGSGPNTTSAPRIGLQVIYMATHCKKSRADATKESAMLVRGQDTYGHWEPEPIPQECMGDAEVQAHTRSTGLEKANYFADSEGRKGYHK
mmetsp:Transcript_167493/g.532457  ORF Transcript_167493/g.532457 Transcript_167493/m.532457 type:complete len:300 (-) Transcript_167493:635-1534(-)